MRRWSALLAAVVSAIATALPLASCGGGDEESSGAARMTVSLTEPSPGRLRYLAPRSTPGGVVEIRFTNLTGRPRKAQLWRILGEHSLREAVARRRSPVPDWLQVAGGTGTAPPDGETSAVQRLPPGRYFVAGTGDERAATPISVSPGATGRALPRGTGSITADDYRFGISRLRAGRSLIVFRNVGREPHHAFLAPLRREAKLGDVLRFLKRGGPRSPVYAERAQETAILGGGQTQLTQLELAPGRYALLCYVRNRAGGPRHTDRGMVAEVTVR